MAVADRHDIIRRDLDEMGLLIEQLKREYDMYFAGVLKKPPLELKSRLDATMRKYRGTQIHKLELSFRFQSIQAKYNKYVEFWDKVIKRREIDPHARSPYGPTREQLAKEFATRGRDSGRESQPARSEAAPAASAADPFQSLYRQYVDAKRELGESVANIKYDSFRQQIERQLDQIKKKTGAPDVEFNVTRKDGKVSLTAKPKRSE